MNSVFCPTDGFEFPLPPNAPHGVLICCPQCLNPLRLKKVDAETCEPFLTPENPDRLNLQERNGWEHTRDQLMSDRLKKASSERRIIQ